MSKTPVRRTGSALLAIASVVLAGIAGCAVETPERNLIRPVRAVTVADVGGLQSRAFPGRARATQEIDLAFRVGGPLIVRAVDVGSEVEQGEVVARIDPRDFEVEVRNVQSRLAESQARLDRARGDYNRLQAIYKEDPGATSQSAIERAREQRDASAANLQALQSSLAAAQDRLDDSFLRAPFDGVVVNTFVENFENVRANQPIVRIVDKSHIEMVISVPENLITLSNQVESVTLEFDTFPGRMFEASVVEIGTQASELTRTFPVTLRMDQPEDVVILPGMAGRARVTKLKPAAAAQAAGVVVPVGAVFTTDTETGSQVWVIERTEGDQGVLARRPVKTGGLTRTGVSVTEGLNAGELIVTAGVHSVQQGQTVRILN